MKIQPADFDKVKFEQNLNHQLFKTSDSILNPLTIKTEFGYDGIPDSNLYELKSTVLVNNDTLRQMRFASAEKINEETIELTIFETSPLYHQELTVQIVKDEFKMTYSPELNMYTCPVLLKQSYYNYHFILRDKDGKIDYSFTEGNHQETENDYTILVYHKNVFYGYDEIIGLGSRNSNTLKK